MIFHINVVRHAKSREHGNLFAFLNVVQVLNVLTLRKVYLSLLGSVVGGSHAGVGGDVVSQHMWC